jgi:hypothetical protein
MRTEYDFTPEEKARLDEIDRTLQDLCRRKLDIYARARVRYVDETSEEIKELERKLALENLMIHGDLLGNYGVLKKEGIANLKFVDKESED